MSVKLSSLYQEIVPEHDVQLLTSGCFDKTIDWIHMVENIEFIPHLHGNELIFNSTLSEESDGFRKKYIDQLIIREAGGLIIALQDGMKLSTELVEYCNALHFPLLQASWKTSYMAIMRRFSEILLSNEHDEINLVASLKNAIYYPQDEALYLPTFERNGFFMEQSYIIAILKCEDKVLTKSLKKEIGRILKHNVLYEEKDYLVILCPDCTPEKLKASLLSLSNRYPDIHVGIGTQEKRISDIHRSRKNALVAFHLSEKQQAQFLLCYDELGIYQILSDVKEPETLYPAFVQNTLGVLHEYDAKNKTDYMDILKLYFENNCSITQTANATYYHQNTLKYKIKAIKEILGYDITTNDNRVKIMISLYLLRLGIDFFAET